MRRSPMDRKPKPKRCKWCRETFTPTKMGQEACKPFPCAVELGRRKETAKREKASREQKRADRARLEEIKTKPQLTKEAQKEFNRFIRLRDHDLPCISCGNESPGGDPRGGLWDSSHYRSVGSMPSLRFEPLNAHKGCKHCNRDKSGNIVEYRIGLIERVGQENVDWLEGPHPAKNYTRDELREIRDKYRKLANELQKQIGRN